MRAIEVRCGSNCCSGPGGANSHFLTSEGVDLSNMYCPYCNWWGGDASNPHILVSSYAPGASVSVASLPHEEQLSFARMREEESLATHRAKEQCARDLAEEEVRRFKETGQAPIAQVQKLAEAAEKDAKAKEAEHKAAERVAIEANRSTSIQLDHEHRMAKVAPDQKLAEIRELNDAERQLKLLDHDFEVLKEKNRVEEMKLKMELEKTKVEHQANTAQRWKAFNDAMTTVVGPGSVIVLFRQLGFVAGAYIVSDVLAEVIKNIG